MRLLQNQTYSHDVFTDENTLYNHKLIDPVSISKNITYLYGKDSQMFPLLNNTEGKGLTKSVKPKQLNDSQYDWTVMGRMVNTSKVVAQGNLLNTAPGVGFTPFTVIFEDATFIGHYTLTSPDGAHRCRIQGEPVKLGVNRYEATLRIIGSNITEFVSLDNFNRGKSWVMGAPIDAFSKSDGNRSNSMSPGKMTNQFSLHRFSKPIAGNVANKVTVYEFDTDSGKTNLWMPHEMTMFELDRREKLEEHLWFSKYNRDANGQITLFDEVTNEPIPEGAGIKEILTYGGNYDTYAAPTLTLAKLNGTINRIFSNRIDKTPMTIVMYTGAGGVLAFDNALKTDANNKSYFVKLGESEIKSMTGGLTYGAYFDTYRTIGGYTIQVRECNIFNHGQLAEMDRANGNTINGFPISSYDMVFIDHSMNDSGEANVQLVAEEGRELITNIYKGMSPLPAVWGALGSGNILSTKKDEASYEVLTTQGIAMLNWTTSFWLAAQR